MDEERREILDALSDKTRLAILEAVSGKPMTGDEIAEAVQRSRSTVESHLSMLLRLGLVSRTKDDKRYYYQATEKAKAWTANTGESPPPSPPPPALRKRGLSPLLIVVIVGAVAGVYYVLVNAFLVPFPIWLFAIILGVACAWICSTLKRLLQIFLVTSLVVAALSAAVGVGQLDAITLILLFTLSIAFLVVLGLPLWYLVRWIRAALSRRGK